MIGSNKEINGRAGMVLKWKIYGGEVGNAVFDGWLGCEKGRKKMLPRFHLSFHSKSIPTELNGDTTSQSDDVFINGKSSVLHGQTIGENCKGKMAENHGRGLSITSPVLTREHNWLHQIQRSHSVDRDG